MSVLLEIRNASKRYGDQVLLDETSATITDEGKTGFIGRNGAGKSTLLRIILGEEELDAGEVIRHPRLRLGYLRQHDPFKPDETTLDFLHRDSGQPEWKCGEVAGQFELKGDKLHGPVQKLSGGWQTRVKLAALLLHEPTLLLLDEPTNFLDLRTQIILEHFLRGYREACLIVSHDRAFLRSTCTQTLDLSHGVLTSYPGPIDAFLEHQQEQRLFRERNNAAVLTKKKQLEDFIARNRARASTASRAKSKSKQLEKLELEELQIDVPTAAIRCPQVSRRNGAAVRCRDLTIGYEASPSRSEVVVAHDIDLDLIHGERAAIVGDNGQGKTTFLRTLVGSLPALGGTTKWGYGCDTGIYAQHVYTSLSDEDTVIAYLERASHIGTKQQQILDLAAAMLFRGSAIDKNVGVLSGGERARLCLAGLLLGGANVLVLDEPGNHLDVETVEALAEALVAYEGTVIFTSHDRSFVQKVATSVIEVNEGRVVTRLGTYAQYLDLIEQEVNALDASRDGRLPGKKNAKAGHGKKSAQQADRSTRREIANLEKTIGRLDAEKKEHEAALLKTTDPDDAVALHGKMTAVAEKLAIAEDKWLALQDSMTDS